jgi:riboflavin kinase/FMN adenylyltransferase
VVRGAALGRRWGYPTANLDLHPELHPPPGVSGGWAGVLVLDGGGGAPLLGVANMGSGPTGGGARPRRPRLEVHLLDFEGDLYGRRLEFAFLARLRGEQRFESLEALAAQIRRDVEAGRRALAEAAGRR